MQLNHLGPSILIFFTLVRGVCNLLGSVSPQQNVKRWTDQCYCLVLFGKQKKIHPQANSKEAKRREASSSIFIFIFFNVFIWLLFLCFFLLPLSLPYVNWASQEGYLLHLRFSVWSLDLPLFQFCRLSPSLSFSHRYPGLLFSYSNYFTSPTQEMGGQLFGNRGVEVSLATSY